MAQLEKRKEKLALKPTIPESITNLINLNLLIDNNPTLAQYTLYQSIMDRIEVDEDKKVTAIYLNGFSENILKELQEDVN